MPATQNSEPPNSDRQTTNLFQSAPLNPPDSIFGLIEMFKQDTRSHKINLSVGVYQDESGATPVMKSVRAAEEKMLASAGSKKYLPIDGSPAYNEAVGELLLGESISQNGGIHSATAQTPGGTVSLRIAGELLRRVFDVNTIWMSNPTWANHPQIYGAAGLAIKQYEYLDENKTGLDLQRILDSLANAKRGEAILLHAVCHNPTGVDPTPEQWLRLLSVVKEKGLFPIFDFAYQGFGVDLEADAFPIRHFIESGGEALICNSFSKNFGLYAERVGGITVATHNADSAAAMRSQIQSTIRTMYSNPPLHGGQIVQTILTDSSLRAQWEQELAEIRNRILELRAMFVSSMQELAPDRDFGYINQQRGMFSYSGLTADQVGRLKDDHAIYALKSGRINVAGINGKNLGPLCKAIASVL
jgi:aspartate aminotransferase